jgi:hypothetical protein
MQSHNILAAEISKANKDYLPLLQAEANMATISYICHSFIQEKARSFYTSKFFF